MTFTSQSDITAIVSISCGQDVAAVPVLEACFPLDPPMLKMCKLLVEIMPCNDFIRPNCHQKEREKEREKERKDRRGGGSEWGLMHG